MTPVMEIFHSVSMEIIHQMETVHFHRGSVVRAAVLVHFCTMHSPTELFELIEKRRRELGLSQADLGLRAFGKADNTAVQSLKKGSSPSVERMAALAEALDLELYIGPRRSAGTAPPTLTLDGDEFAAIPRLAVEASAGAGAYADQPEVVGKLAFRHDWLRKIGVRPDKAMLITITGDSMAPGLEPGDLALIDQARTAWVHNALFALVDIDGAVRLKRVLLDRGRALVLLSDNPAHPPEARTGPDAARVKALGQVVWSGHSWG